MNLKYATLGLISGYLAGYVLDYLQNKNFANSSTLDLDNSETIYEDKQN
jgi:hypothetical protein